MSEHKRLKIAVVGAGVSGLTAAYLLNAEHDIHLFEANDYLGGHTRTLNVQEKNRSIPVDTGFIVMNHRNYPLFSKLLERLEVPLADSSMTFSFEDVQSDYAYAGNSFGSLFPNKQYFFRRDHWSLLKDLYRFSKFGYRDLMEGKLVDLTLGEYCAKRNLGSAFLDNYLYPMGAAIWSSPISEMQAFPAEPYLHFLENHGLLRLTNRPQWRFVKGGSKTYVERIGQSLGERTTTDANIAGIRRNQRGVQITFSDGRIQNFDKIVIGTHADQALKLLEDPTDDESNTLGKWRYQKNKVILHTDTSLLPKDRRLWASWNFRRSRKNNSENPVAVSYYMNRLQNLDVDQDYIVTLNPQSDISANQVINETVLDHPLYDFDSLATQSRLQDINGQNDTFFCGSYFGYGFHEDGVRSAVSVASAFGIEL